MTTIQTRPGVDSRDVDGEVVVWDGASLHLLDAMAAAVWRLIDGTRTQADIVAALAGQFTVGPGRLERDVAALLRSLTSLGLLQAGDTRPD